MKSLNTRAWTALIVVSAAEGLLIFISAGTVDYWQAWLLLALFVGSSSLVTLYLMRNNAALLERRMKGGPTREKRLAQKIVMTFAALGFIALLVVPGLDRRFGWSAVPTALVLAGDFLVLLGLYLTFLVYRVNRFTSATIEIAQEQVVISTGPYAVVRHPMYSAGLVYLTGMPLGLASYWGLVGSAAMVLVLAWRLLDEEKLLIGDLKGYSDYCAKVRWRLIPGVF